MAKADKGERAEDLQAWVSRAVASDSTVLITGATGTGKSTLAAEIHRRGNRREGPFVPVNLASLHEATIESTLFGHERGAFTGADRARVGRLELADRGTLFLDEIGELSLPLQARLLEFLQSRKLTPLGSNRERTIDARLICATHRDLETDVKRGRFREDLFHRIRVLDLALPGLAEMEGESFACVIHDAIEGVSEKVGKKILGISGSVAELFECYSWPGNFRELENTLEAALLACSTSELQTSDLPRRFIERVRAEPVFMWDREVSFRVERGGREVLAAANVPVSRSYIKTMKKFEMAILRFYMERHRGNLARAAREAGLPRATFYRKVHNLGLLSPLENPVCAERMQPF